MYKSKLQELCHEKLWGLPRYTAMKDGPDHNPCFKASVSVNGFSFDSPVACKSSKHAQNQAAMLAFLHFTSPPSLSSVDDEFKARLTAEDILKEAAETAAPNAISMSSSQDASQQTNDDDDDDKCGRYKNLLQELAQKRGVCLPEYKTVTSGASHLPTFSSTVVVEGQKFSGKAEKSKKLAELVAAKSAYIALTNRGLSRPTPIKTDQISDLKMTIDPPAYSHQDTSNLKREDFNSSIAEVKIDDMNETRKTSSGELKSYLLCNRVRVYTQFPEMEFPNNLTVLPIGDDKWVAFRLEFPNEENSN